MEGNPVAQKVQVVLVDDLDGGQADETVSFSLDGVSYEIDLSAANAETMRDTLAQFVGVARRVGGRTAARGRRGAVRASSDGRASEIRAWAKEHGFEVSDRGRVSSEVREAYEKATR